MADVAKRAGVSPTAVSFVINGRADGAISPDTQRRILAAVDDLGYRPNLTAQSLRTRQTRTLGFVTDEIAVKAPGGQTISGAHDVARRHGSLLLITNATRDQRVLRRAIDDILDRQVDALLFAVVGTRRTTLPDVVRTVPTVLVNCYTAGNTLPCVLPDEASGGRAAAQLVVDAGHRRIAFAAGLAGSWATRERVKGFHAVLREASIGPDDAPIVHGNYRADSGYELTKGLLARRRRPTAILCGNDLMAVGALFAAKEVGIAVPAELSIVGYDDREDLAADVRPALTTVRLPYYEMGRVAAEHIVAGTVGDLPARTYIPCPVVERATVGSPPVPSRPWPR